MNDALSDVLAKLDRPGPNQPEPRKRDRIRPQKPFIVDIDSSVVRELSRHADHLYHALRRLADGKSGELRIGGRWLKATRFDKEAKMCRDTRLPAMRELRDKGLVTVERPRVHRTIDGRVRAVAGGVHYTVHRQPVDLRDHHKAKDSSKVDLQKSVSTTIVNTDPQFLSNPPSTAGAGSVGVDLDLGNLLARAPSSSPAGKPDEDDGARANFFRTDNHPNPVGKSAVDERPKPKRKKLAPALRAWMDARILSRAQQEIRSRRAYLRASRPEFVENVAEEVETYLMEQAEEFLAKKIQADPQCTVRYTEVFGFLDALSNRHELPTAKDPKLFERTTRFASEVLGLVERPIAADSDVDGPVNCEHCFSTFENQQAYDDHDCQACYEEREGRHRRKVKWVKNATA